MQFCRQGDALLRHLYCPGDAVLPPKRCSFEVSLPPPMDRGACACFWGRMRVFLGVGRAARRVRVRARCADSRTAHCGALWSPPQNILRGVLRRCNGSRSYDTQQCARSVSRALRSTTLSTDRSRNFEAPGCTVTALSALASPRQIAVVRIQECSASVGSMPFYALAALGSVLSLGNAAPVTNLHCLPLFDIVTFWHLLWTRGMADLRWSVRCGCSNLGSQGTSTCTPPQLEACVGCGRV